jgi:hypothetical protein
MVTPRFSIFGSFVSSIGILGLFVSSLRSSLAPAPQLSPTEAPTLSPTEPPVVPETPAVPACCYSWKDLRSSILNAKKYDVITICQGASLTVPGGEGPIKVKALEGLTVQCSDCRISGGHTQFEIDAAPYMTFKGLKLTDASDAQVKIKYPEDSVLAPAEVKFQDCEFSSSELSLDWSNAAIYCDNLDLVDYGENSGNNSKLTIENTKFERNHVHDCVICNHGCALEVRTTLFKYNYAFLDGWSASLIRNFRITVDRDMVNEASLSIVDSCFIGNTGSLSSMLFDRCEDCLGFETISSGNSGRGNFPCDGFYWQNWSFYFREDWEPDFIMSALPMCREFNTTACVRFPAQD